MANNKKKLNLKAIETASKKFTTKKIIIPVNDVEYEVEIDEVFKTTKIEALIREFLESSQKNNLNELDNTVKFSYYFYFIFKYFTDIDIPKNLKFKDELKLISELIDLGIYEQISKNIPQTEIKKVNEYMQELTSNLNEMLKDDKFVNDLKGIAENESILGDGDDN
jgi:hypothetical protein